MLRMSMKSHWKFWWQYIGHKYDQKYNLCCCVKDGIKGSECRARKEENELKWWLKNEYLLYFSSYLQRYPIQSGTTTPQLLTLNKHCYLSPPHITLITASPIDGKDPSHDSFRWTFCTLPDKHQIPKAFVFAWPHESGKLLQSRHMPRLLFCWLPANLAKEGLELKTLRSICALCTQHCFEISCPCFKELDSSQNQLFG